MGWSFRTVRARDSLVAGAPGRKHSFPELLPPRKFSHIVCYIFVPTGKFARASQGALKTLRPVPTFDRTFPIRTFRFFTLLTHTHASPSFGWLCSHISYQLDASPFPQEGRHIASRPAVLTGRRSNTGSARKIGSEAARREARREEGLMNEGSHRVGIGLGASDKRSNARVGLAFRGTPTHGDFRTPPPPSAALL